MKSLVLDALSKLNPENDDHWTSEGSPKVGVVRSYAADTDISREDIEAAAPGFSRSNTELPMFSDPEKLMETPVEDLTDDEKTGLVRHLEGEIANKTSIRDQLLVQLKGLRDKITIEDREIESLQTKLNEVNPPPTPQEQIARYLERQQKDKIDALQKAQETAQALPNITMSDLDRSVRRENRRAKLANVG